MAVIDGGAGGALEASIGAVGQAQLAVFALAALLWFLPQLARSVRGGDNAPVWPLAVGNFLLFFSLGWLLSDFVMSA
jgi:hypothetical protein